ncbi:hypothetical protein BV22DRAFT_1049116 [Leucogyrophana mollusca]|uniref:Uncharacterized protein n=1 Tax=Leucogyrophana mollusca TaxID=85980 RepID=A0ACB8BAA1_9AGAM|nr:hypothetical protein BV22DRAFT_1049116 [Leucogyrophana mollusca]
MGPDSRFYWNDIIAAVVSALNAPVIRETKHTLVLIAPHSRIPVEHKDGHFACSSDHSLFYIEFYVKSVEDQFLSIIINLQDQMLIRSGALSKGLPGPSMLQLAWKLEGLDFDVVAAFVWDNSDPTGLTKNVKGSNNALNALLSVLEEHKRTYVEQIHTYRLAQVWFQWPFNYKKKA